MKHAIAKRILTVLLVTGLSAFGDTAEANQSQVLRDITPDAIDAKYEEETMNHTDSSYTVSTVISDVIHDPVFGNYGRLIFPVDDWYYSGNKLGELRLTWYNNIDPDKTVEIANYMKDHAEAGDTIFYDIYTEEEKEEDPEKEDTGLFFFKGNPGERFAICNAGGGFAYVGAMQDSFPHALELFKQGYNAFAAKRGFSRRRTFRETFLYRKKTGWRRESPSARRPYGPSGAIS